MGLGGIADQLKDLQLGELLDTPPPGVDEAVAISKVVQFLKNPNYSHFERIIFDTAPTGESRNLFPPYLPPPFSLIFPLSRDPITSPSSFPCLRPPLYPSCSLPCLSDRGSSSDSSNSGISIYSCCTVKRLLAHIMLSFGSIIHCNLLNHPLIIGNAIVLT